MTSTHIIWQYRTLDPTNSNTKTNMNLRKKKSLTQKMSEPKMAWLRSYFHLIVIIYNNNYQMHQLSDSNKNKKGKKNQRRIWNKKITSTMRTPGIIGLSGKCPGKKLSLIVTFLIATAETPGLYSITLSTKRNGNL